MKIDEKEIEQLAQKAADTSKKLLSVSTEHKNRVILKMAELIAKHRAKIQGENSKDIQAGKEKGLSEPLLNRLELSNSVLESMVNGLEQVASLPDPVGTVSQMMTRPNGIQVGRMNVPLGVVCMIYEARPNVTVDAAALCLKAGNAAILRGGSEAIHSNVILAEVLQEALMSCNLAKECVQVVSSTDRKAVDILLQQEDYIDLVIPRGGEGLIRYVNEKSRVPVLKHYKGVCHVYIDRNASFAKATPIVVNAKVQRPGVCNALEGVLIDEQIAAEYIPEMIEALRSEGVTVLGCKKTAEIDSTVEIAGQSDWGTEFLDLKLCVKVVSGYDEAKSYISKYGSNHTEVIITEDYSLARRFLREIDASAVMVNASTRFNDGGELGLGTEIGISTSKLHAYGPMGLEELTSKKFIVFGDGQIRT